MKAGRAAVKWGIERTVEQTVPRADFSAAIYGKPTVLGTNRPLLRNLKIRPQLVLSSQVGQLRFHLIWREPTECHAGPNKVCYIGGVTVGRLYNFL